MMTLRNAQMKAQRRFLGGYEVIQSNNDPRLQGNRKKYCNFRRGKCGALVVQNLTWSYSLSDIFCALVTPCLC